MDIYYESIGEGFPIICLHGNSEDHHIFDDAVKILSKKYQCLLIDSRYHGRSVHQGELSYEQMAKDVQKIVSDLHINAYGIIGFSDGAIVSLMLGMNDLRVKHIVSIGANTKPQMLKPICRLGMYLTYFCLLPFCIYNPKARTMHKLYQLMLHQPQIEYSDLHKIHIPVLVMAGEYDMIKQEDTQKIGEALPYSAVKIIKQGNHFLLRDYFQQTMKEIELFLKACHQEESNESMSD